MAHVCEKCEFVCVYGAHVCTWLMYVRGVCASACLYALVYGVCIYGTHVLHSSCV